VDVLVPKFFVDGQTDGIHGKMAWNEDNWKDTARMKPEHGYHGQLKLKHESLNRKMGK
jgi:hypothetical protein